jgi:integrase
VYLHHGCYFFVDRAGKWHNLGRTLADAYRALADHVEVNLAGRTMSALFDRYMTEVIPTKAPRTQRDNGYELQPLRAALGAMNPRHFKPKHGYAYFNERKKKSLRRAVAELALLSHVFTKAVEWGVVDDNPCRQIRKERPRPRRRYVTEAEYAAASKTMPAMLQCAMDLAVLTGLRPADLLALTRSNLTDEGIQVSTRKTGRDLVIAWSDELRRVVKRALSLPPKLRQPLICGRQGKPYTVDGFTSIWRRKIRKALADPENSLQEPFQFRDLRAKSASDDTAEAATARLGHTNAAITERVYRRKPEVDPTGWTVYLG